MTPPDLPFDTPLALLFWLIAAHFLGDFPLQSDFIAKNKRRAASPVWAWVLSAHAATHAALVALVLSPLFGLAEFIAHAATDHAKSEGLFGREPGAFHIDQSIHLATKLVWLGLYLWGPAFLRV